MDERGEFLRTWYGVLWSNIDRSMTSMWHIVGPIGLVGAAFIYMDRLGVHLTVSLQLVIVFWALNNTIDMNSWHRRNTIFAARVERHFLKPTDYGVVIPTSFREPRTDWIEFYLINFLAFLALTGIIVVIYIVKAFRSWPFSPCLVLGPTVIFLVGLASTIWTFRRCERQIDKYLSETHGATSQT